MPCLQTHIYYVYTFDKETDDKTCYTVYATALSTGKPCTAILHITCCIMLPIMTILNLISLKRTEIKLKHTGFTCSTFNRIFHQVG